VWVYGCGCGVVGVNRVQQQMARTWTLGLGPLSGTYQMQHLRTNSLAAPKNG